MEEADWLVDFGPGPGATAARSWPRARPAQVMKSKASLTGRYLRGDLRSRSRAERRQGDGRTVTRAGARENNLKDVDRRRSRSALFVCGDRRLRRGQEHPRQPHPLPRDRPGPPRQRPRRSGAHRADRGPRGDRQGHRHRPEPDRADPALEPGHLHQALRPRPRLLRRAARGADARLHARAASPST
ncbi:MAG: hypothetical protein MZW92_56440 [Comamonadaceae bacterium]|nr:hypothetical protein [Comamonadaceae bacterium]